MLCFSIKQTIGGFVYGNKKAGTLLTACLLYMRGRLSLFLYSAFQTTFHASRKVEDVVVKVGCLQS